ncbi:MAG: hypothetical protein IPJ76_15910 [Flavobacteriales bacterium]|nr:MAG: hypothetical protein IPJ76_15910 [Flavobacteriales bacterium]
MNNWPKKNLILSRPDASDQGCIRVLLNGDTQVLVKTLKDFERWKERYPDARIIGSTPLVGNGPADRSE